MTYEELGQRVKAKYPVYANLPDRDLGIRVARKYPEYNAQIEEAQPMSGMQMLGEVAGAPIPGLSRVAQFMRTDLPNALAEQSGIPGAIAGTVIAMAGEFIPATVGELGGYAASPAVGKVAGAGFRTLGKGLGSLSGKVAAPFAGMISNEAQGAMRVAGALGAKLTPAEITGSKGLSVMESGLGESALGAGPIREAGAAQAAALGREAERIVGRYGPSTTKEALGIDLQRKQSQRSEAFSRLGGRLYRHVDELLPEDNFVVTTNLSNTAAELLEKEQSIIGKKNTALIGELETLASAPGGNFKSLHMTKSDLLDKVRKADSGLSARGGAVKFKGSREGGVYKRLAGAIERDMDAYAAQANPEVKNAYDAARSFWRENRVLYDSNTVRKLSTKDPEALLRVIVRPGAVTEIRELRRVVGPRGMMNVKRAFLEDAFGVNAQQPFTPQKFAASIDKYGNETLNALFSRDEFEAISQLAHVSKFVGRAQRVGGNPSGTARHMLNVASFSGAGIALWMHNPMTAAAAVLSPRVMARLYLSDVGRKWLTIGFRTPINSATAGQVSENLLKVASGIGGQEFILNQQD